MMSAAIRVLARAAAIQLEEMAASTSTAVRQPAYRSSALDKGKGRADAIPPDSLRPDPRVEVNRTGEEIVHEQQELLERDQVRLPDAGPSSIPIPRTETSSGQREFTLGARGPALSGSGETMKPIDGLSASFAGLVDEQPSKRPHPSAFDQLGGKQASSFHENERSKSFAGPSEPRAGSPAASSSKAASGKLSRKRDPIPEPTRVVAKDEQLSGAGRAERQSPIPITPESEPPSRITPSTEPVDESRSAEPEAIPKPSSEHPPPSPVDPPIAEVEQAEDEAAPILRASTVPSSRIGRLFHYGSLAASLSWGAASESMKRGAGGGSSGSVFMSDANIRRLVASLSRMRGAALKLGQFMSIQDNHMFPPEIERVLQQVQAHANYMPDWQMEKVISTELGASWSDLFSTFERTPIASASIGQVHRATLAERNTPLAVKIQFPGIADSISSDLSYLTPLLRSSSVLPKGMFLQNTVAVMRRELADECDYIREGAAAERFRKLLHGDPFFEVPKVIQEATTGRVLTMEWAEGKPLSKVKSLSQAIRDKIGTNILRLCLIELFQFRFMQTDPNLANFLYDAPRDRMTLIDFGASREYSKEFMDGWYRLLTAAIRGDRGEMKDASEEIGYLTGEETEEMVNAHIDSMALVASPFAHSGPYDFSNQTITDSVRQLIPIMLKHRLTPPPQETYSLNRKLSGAFLVCAKLGARVDCSKLWQECASGYQVGPETQAAAEDVNERVAATA